MKNNTNYNYLIIALFLVIMIDTMGVGFVWPLFGPLFTGKNSTLFSSAVSMEWRNILYGIAIGMASLTAFLGAPILGNISDRIGRRKILLLCLIGTCLGMGISVVGLLFKQVWIIIFSRAWLGAISASQVIAQAAIIDISTPDNKSARLGIISAANNIGFIFGPVISSILIDQTLVRWFNLTTPFYFAATLAFLSSLYLLMVFKEPPKTLSSPPQDEGSKKTLIFTKAFTDPHIRKTSLLYFLLQIGWALYLQTNFLSLIQKYNCSSQRLGYFLMWLGIVFCFNLLVMVRLLVRPTRLKKIVYITFTIATISCLMAALNRQEVNVWIILLPMATAIALGSNAILTNFSNLAKKHEQGWIMGVGKSLTALAWAITPPLTGVILRFGFSLPLFIASSLFLGGVIICSRTRWA